METLTVTPTSPLLRPDQLESAREEIKSLEAKMTNPLIEDKGQVRRQLQNARKATEMQTPHAPQNAEEEGRMVSKSRELLGKILEGMPSQEEMRKAPPGAVEKHRSWETRNKARILEWKNLQLRLTAGSGDRDAANLEKHRPTSSSLNMDSAFIQGKNFFMPEMTGPAVTFNDDQIAVLRKISPALADQLALMPNVDRQQVKDAISGIGLASKASIDGKRGTAKKRKLSADHKAKMLAGAAKARAEKKAKE